MGEDAALLGVIFWRRRHFRVQKFCLRDARKCDDREKEEEREWRGQLRPEKLGGPFLPLMCCVHTLDTLYSAALL